MSRGRAGASRSCAGRLADSQALIYMGFAEEDTSAEFEASLESSIDELRGATRPRARLPGSVELADRRDVPRPATARGTRTTRPSRKRPLREAAFWTPWRSARSLDREIADGQGCSSIRLEKQIGARTRALPLYKETLGHRAVSRTSSARGGTIPVHTLLRRMYHENRA